jgi:hypothetical protein
VYIVQTMTAMMSQNLLWILEAVMHANYLFILVGVSILWRPNSQAKGKNYAVITIVHNCTTPPCILSVISTHPLFVVLDYAMQMEIPSLSGDDNELELSCNMPSAEDMGYDEGNDPDHPNGIRVNNAVLG